MKPIKPVKVWFKDGLTDLEFLKVISVYDNLVDYVKFEFSVVTQDQTVGGGIVELKGDKYGTWDASASGAYEIVALSAGLQLLENANTWMSAE